MRKFIEKRITTNNSVYKKTAILPVLKCPRCQPNRGCNAIHRDNDRNCWKSHRKTKWKDD